jgi:hypothetical protein
LKYALEKIEEGDGQAKDVAATYLKQLNGENL